jgi:proton-translocating NADH-quinone oxidoreductase chain M
MNRTNNFQYFVFMDWLPHINLHITFGIDGISLFFIILTSLLTPLCLLASWELNKNLKNYLILFLLIEFLLISSFCSLDLMTFYICFESTLIPMFLIIGIWGSRTRKIKASYYFSVYTLLGSVLMLISILYLLIIYGTSNYEILLMISPYMGLAEQKVICFTFFFAFATKVPIVPFHLWLPEAHVEAPTTGSVMLAGILLKLGVYGFLRFTLPLFPQACIYFTPLTYTICIVSVVFSSITAMRQTDFKRVIAYASIAHMNVVILGVFSYSILGIQGAVFQIISHGLVLSAFFLIIGFIYERYKTRLLIYYYLFIISMPINIIIFFILYY